MGLSIHFNGKLQSGGSLPLLTEEVKDICEIHNWPCKIFEAEFPADAFGKEFYDRNIYGICFTPPGCETVSLCFLSNGNLVSFPSWAIYVKSERKDKELLSGGASVKTQYAGPVIHKILIHLLDYLSIKHFSEFNLMDEGQYWETRDEALLDKNFAVLTSLINSVGNMLEANAMKPSESFEKYFERILKMLHSRKK